MLTNNKKRSFVKLIALTMAALMVFSVCLTGCTDKTAQQMATDAQNAANAAQDTADKATTAEEVAAAITEKLADYLKTADAISEDDVKALIAAELANCATADDLKAYATTEALEALSKKVTDHLNDKTPAGVTMDEVNAAITKAVANYVVKSEIQKMIDAVDVLTVDDVKKIVNDVMKSYNLGGFLTAEDLKDYVTAADVDTAIKAALKAYMGDLAPEKVFAILTTMVEEFEGEHMSEADWNAATAEVITALTLADTLLNDLEDRWYLDSAKAQINELTNIKVFPEIKDKDGKVIDYGAYDAAGIDAQMATIGLQLLRAPNVEAIEAIINGFKAALEVEWFQVDSNLAAIKTALYSIGTLAEVDANADKVADKYTAATVYQGKTYAKDAVILNQVVWDAAHKTAYAQVQADLDAFLLAYAADLDGENNFPIKRNNIYVTYKISYKDAAGKAQEVTKTVKAVDYKGNLYSGATAVEAATLVSGTEIKATVVENSYNIGLTTDASVYAATAPTTGVLLIGFKDGKYLPDPDINTDACGYTVTGLASVALNTADVEGETVSFMESYAAVAEMLDDVDVAVKIAENTFKAFLAQIKASTGCADTDAGYLAALRDYMCSEDIMNDATGYVHPDWQKADTIYLLDVAEDFNYAANIRGKTTHEGLYKYELFDQMNAKITELVFDQVQKKALDLLTIMMNDYIISVGAADLAVANGGDVAGYGADAAAALGYGAGVWSDGFVAAFYNGNKYTWHDSLAKDKAMIGLKQYLENNEFAWALKADGATFEMLDADILEVIAENQIWIKQELSAATIKPRMDIVNAEYKAGMTLDDLNPLFAGYLDTAKKNLDETIYRWTFEEIKEGVMNSLYALVVEETVSFDTFFDGTGIAKYYNDGIKGDATYLQIERTLKNYLTGVYQDAAGKNVKGDAAASVWAKWVKITLPEGLESPENDEVMEYTATALVADILEARTAAVLYMECLAIEIRFDDYLDEARKTLWFTYNAYKMNPLAQEYAIANALAQAYNTRLNDIAGIEYNAHVYAEKYGVSEYKKAYVDLLKIVIANDSTYYKLLDYTYDGYLAKYVKSSGVADASAWKNLITPVEPFAGAEAYYSAGSAISLFDEVANVDAFTTDKDGKIVKLY